MGLLGKLIGRKPSNKKEIEETSTQPNSGWSADERQGPQPEEDKHQMRPRKKTSKKYESSLHEIHQIKGKGDPLDDLNEYAGVVCRDNKSLFKIIKHNKKKNTEQRE
jgi:hypothetical protein